jgi:hypothetical protein
VDQQVKTIRIPLVGSLTNRNPNAAIADTKDQRFVNCFPQMESNSITGKQTVWLNKRQGCWATSVVESSATGSYGAVVWTANSAAAAPAVFSFRGAVSTSTRFFTTLGTQIGSGIPDTNGCISIEETDISGTGTLTAMLTDIASTSTVELWTFAEGGAWAQVTSAPMATTSNPITPAHCHMDGYAFVMREDGRLYHSDVNTVSSWTAANFITANSYADNGVGCARYRNLVVGFGDYSCEFFYNAGNATGSVLSRIENATLRIGAIRNSKARGTAIRSIGNTVYWLGVSADSGARAVYRLNGMQPDKVSTPAIDKMLSQGEVNSILGSFNMLGQSHIAFGGGTTTAVIFCPDTKFWWYLTTGGAMQIAAFLSASGQIGPDDTTSYFTSKAHANVFTIDPNAPLWQDAASSYSLTVQTDNMDLGTRKKKFWKSAALIGDEATSTFTLSYSDDDYATSSAALSVAANGKLTRLGSSRRRSWIWQHNASTAARVQAMEYEYEEGAS